MVGADVKDLMDEIRPLLDMPNVEVILSARSGLFLAADLDLLKGFEVLRLQKWDVKTDWPQYVDGLLAIGYVNSLEADALKALSGPVRGLVDKPLYCRMIVEQRESILEEGVRNAAELFQKYIKGFWDRGTVIQNLMSRVNREMCLREMAYQMESSNKQWRIDEIANLINKEYPHLSNPEDWRTYLTGLRVSVVPRLGHRTKG